MNVISVLAPFIMFLIVILCVIVGLIILYALVKANEKNRKQERPITESKKEGFNQSSSVQKETTYEQIPYFENQGSYFEYATERVLKTPGTAYGHYHILRNLYIPKKDGNFAEIDLLLINETGLHIFECKDYHCALYGKTYDVNWRAIYQNGKTHTLYNPILQNESHVKALLQYTNARYELFHSWIIFPDKAAIHLSDTEYVAKIRSISQLSKTFYHENEMLYKFLTPEQIDYLTDRLSVFCDAPNHVKIKHRNYVKNIKNERY